MRPHSQQTRQEAVRLYRDEGQPMSKISRQLGVSYTSVRIWIKRYQAEGDQGLVPKYSNCGPPTVFSEEIIERAATYKRRHPKWGAPFILLKLQDAFPGQDLPTPRRLQQIFRKKELQLKRSHLPGPAPYWAKRPFDRVQVDAKERLKTADGQACCYLNFTDEHSGSDLDAFVFPLFPYCLSSPGPSLGLRTLSYVPLGIYPVFSL